MVKPTPACAATEGPLVQPGVKCRGREYLRIIYGPDYTARAAGPAAAAAGWGASALALREYALGLAALDRLAAGGAAVARARGGVRGAGLEVEPVDPRL